MPQPLDFSNQDLRDRSFKGREDLAGADFRKADIRGCDFSNANLEGADFSGVTAGKSSKQIFIVVAGSVAAAYTGAYTAAGWYAAYAGAGVSVIAVVIAVVAAVAVAGWYAVYVDIGASADTYWTDAVAGAYLCAGAYLGASAGVAAVAGAYAAAEFAKGNIFGGIGYSLTAICFIFPACGGLMLVIEFIRNVTGTSFKKVKLVNTKFTGAILNSCDFVNAKIHQIDWTHTYFIRCTFSGYLKNQRIRKLCVSRIGENENFISMDLSELNLIGVNLYGANLANTNLSQTNLRQADLTNTNLCNVQAIKTDFTNANLSGACIENWAITPETNFTNVICSHIFLDSARTERQPASGFLEQGDFAKLVIQSTKSLDFFFRNGIDPQAFDFALNNLMDDYREMGISLKSVEDFGDGDRIVRFNTVLDAPKAEMHAQFTQDYEEMHQQLEASRNKVYELQQKLDRNDLENKIERLEIEKQLAVAIAKLEERPTSKDLQNLLHHQASQLGNQRLLNAPNSTFIDTMTDKPNQINISSSSNVALNTGDNNQGVIGNISGTVTNSIQQLRETNQPEAPQLSDLLEQLQKVVESSDELDKPEKEKALDYLNKIVEMSVKEPAQKKGMLPILLDAFTGVISKAANLIDPVKKIAAAILSIWQA
jgi:uncharacterized protein YjbI with pentapeptide repeats/gas vesicle protein